MLFADIASGNVDLADFCFLAAFIVFVIALIFTFMKRFAEIVPLLLYAGLALLAFAWLVL